MKVPWLISADQECFNKHTYIDESSDLGIMVCLMVNPYLQAVIADPILLAVIIVVFHYYYYCSNDIFRFEQLEPRKLIVLTKKYCRCNK